MADATPNRVYQYTTTTGQGNVTLDGAAVFASFFTADDAVGLGVIQAGDTGVLILEEGDDVEVVEVTVVTVSPFEVSRDTVVASRIDGVAGTAKMNLGGSATAQFIISGERFDEKASTAIANIFTAIQRADPGTLTDNSAADFTTKQFWKGTVNGSAFDVPNPSAITPEVLYVLRFSYTTAHTVSFGTSFKGTIDTPTASAGAVDYFMFMSNSAGTALEYLGASLDVAA